MGRMALAAKEGGACAIRAQGMADIIEIKEVTGLPVFGIVKRDYEGSDIYITPTAKEVRELLAVGVEVIGLDMTARRPHGEKMVDLIALAHEGGAAVLADISTYEGGMAAVRLGADAVSTTLSGYTSYSPQLPGPDVALVRRLAAPCGGYTGAALRRGAHPYGGGPARDHGSGIVRACHRLRDHAAAAHHGALCQSTRGVAAPQGGAGVRERRPGTSMCKGVGKCGSFSQRIMRI